MDLSDLIVSKFSMCCLSEEAVNCQLFVHPIDSTKFSLGTREGDSNLRIVYLRP
jgi:hypothetical protein